MRFGTHYYVISLSRHTSALYEAFRDTLIDVQNRGFPVDAPASLAGATDPAAPAGHSDGLRVFLRIVDECFGHYYDAEPMIVVVTGETDLQTEFTTVTTHGEAIAGRVEGDFSATSPRDLGRIVWPVVKEAMSGARERALRELETAEETDKIFGLENIGRRLDRAAGATLLVEEDYHVRGSISEADGSAAISPQVDVRNEIDDVVDMIIEKVLDAGGNVIFAPDRSLTDAGRIALLLRGSDRAT